MKSKKTKVMVSLGVILGVLGVFGAMRIDEELFNKDLKNQFEEMKSEHEIASYEIDSKSKGFGSKEYKIVVEHTDKKLGKYPSELIITRESFSPKNLKVGFETAK